MMLFNMLTYELHIHLYFVVCGLFAETSASPPPPLPPHETPLYTISILYAFWFGWMHWIMNASILFCLVSNSQRERCDVCLMLFEESKSEIGMVYTCIMNTYAPIFNIIINFLSTKSFPIFGSPDLFIKVGNLTGWGAPSTALGTF